VQNLAQASNLAVRTTFAIYPKTRFGAAQFGWHIRAIWQVTEVFHIRAKSLFLKALAAIYRDGRGYPCLLDFHPYDDWRNRHRL
jgi:hypothetical protein